MKRPPSPLKSSLLPRLIASTSLAVVMTTSLAFGQEEWFEGIDLTVNSGEIPLLVESGDELIFYNNSGGTPANLLVGSGEDEEGLVEMSGGYITLITADSNPNTIRIGNNGGSGTMTMSGGSITISSGNEMHIGSGEDSTGFFNQSEGSVAILGNSSFNIGSGGGTGTYTLSGGSFRTAGAIILGDSIGASGTLNLNGGALEVGGINGIQGGSGTVAFNMGGGTLKVYDAALTTSVGIHLTAGAEQKSFIDTTAGDATLSGAITQDAGGGGLEKIGSGKLTFDGNVQRDMAFFNVAGGEAEHKAGTTNSAEFLAGSGAGNSGTFTMTDGDLNITGTPPYGGTAASLRVGDWGGTGVFDHEGGTVTVSSPGNGAALNIGNQGGTGTYNLNGADAVVILDGGTSIIGRSTGSNGASHGVLNINDGLFHVKTGSRLIIGNSGAGSTAAMAKITQTDGTLRMEGDLNLAGASGHSIYELLGGVLEVGGTSLKGRFSGSTSTYAFNLGNGTIKTIGSDLNTSVNATLQAGGVSATTIEAGLFNATWSGVLSGTGNLKKTGVKTLVLAGENTYTGETEVAAGTLSVASTGSTGTGTVTVNSGATLTGTGTIKGNAFITAGGTLKAGGMTFEKGLTLAANSSTVLEINGLEEGEYGMSIEGTTLAIDGALTIHVNSFLGQDATTTIELYNLTSAVVTGHFNTVTFTGIYGTDDFTYDGLGIWSFERYSGVTWYFDENSGTLVIPEPGTVTLLIGGAAAAWLLNRRRRRA